MLLNYGSGSVKRNGIYDQVVTILKEAGKTIVENPGIMSNPTFYLFITSNSQKLLERD